MDFIFKSIVNFDIDERDFQKKKNIAKKTERKLSGHKISHFKIKIDVFFPKPASQSVFYVSLELTLL